MVTTGADEGQTTKRGKEEAGRTCPSIHPSIHRILHKSLPYFKAAPSNLASIQQQPQRKRLQYMTDPIAQFIPTSTNLFEDDPSGQGERKQRNIIHIRVHQRNGRKTLTTIENMPKELDPKKVLKVFKKEFACNGTIVEQEGGEVIQLQGDHRQKVSQILIEEGIVKKEDLKVHGF